MFVLKISVGSILRRRQLIKGVKAALFEIAAKEKLMLQRLGVVREVGRCEIDV
jgi:hypothetical protein